MVSRLLVFGILCLLVCEAVAQRVGTPAGRITIETRQEPVLGGQQTDTVVLHLDPRQIGEDFAGVGGFRFALRIRPEALFLSFGLPEGGQGSFFPCEELPGWFDFLIDVPIPLEVEDGRVPLVEVRTAPLDLSSHPRWVGPQIQIVASPQSERPGWITWHESPRTGACSDSNPALRPCVRPIDRIDRRLRFSSDRLVTLVPDIVVAPGERFALPVYGRLLSILAMLYETDVDRIETTTSWDANQFDLTGAQVFRRSQLDTFRTRVDYDPPANWINVTDRRKIHALEFVARDGATGSTVFMGPYSSGLSDIGRTVDAGLHGSIRVLDCTPMDLDDDGRVTTADAVAILLRSARDRLSSDGFSAVDLCTGDVDRDGNLESGDAARVLRAVVGLERGQDDALHHARARLERDGDRVLLHVDGSSAADVLLELDGVTWAGARGVRGGMIASASLDGRAAVSLAGSRVEDHVVELDLHGDGSIRLLSARSGEGDAFEVDTTPIVLRAPARFLGAAPNPFNPTTQLRFVLDRSGTVRLDIYDVSGRRLRTIVAEASAGEGSVTWDGTDDAGHEVAAGVYHVRMRSADGMSSGRIILLK